VDEVQLVLLVVVVVDAGGARRDYDEIRAERLHAQRLAHFAEAVAVAKFLERAERIGHDGHSTLRRRRSR
jgi:hypothetical protein